MWPTVLVACDADDRAPVAFAHVIAPLLEARTSLVNVHPTEEADDDGRSVTGARVEHASSASAGLQRLIAEEEPVLTVLGSAHTAGHGRVRVGGTTERVLHGAPGPVAVVPRGLGERPLRSVAVGLLPTPDSLRALRWAAALAGAAAVPLLVVTILRRSPTAADAAAFAAAVAPRFTLSGPPARILRSAILAAAHAHPLPADSPAAAARRSSSRRAASTSALLVEAPVAPVAPRSPRGAAGALDVEPLVLIGDAADALLRVSARAGLLVLGSRAYGPAGVVLPGGAARRVLAGARCPVLLVPRADVLVPA